MDGKYLGKPHKIALLAGGDSSEREISLASGHQAAMALSMVGYEPVLIDPADVNLRWIDWQSFDVCFIALHGGAGEDGTIQSQLGDFGVPYTGSGPVASRLAMSKSASKERFYRCDVPTLPYAVLAACEVLAATSRGAVDKRLESLGFPLAIKPESQGSSLGVGIARHANDLKPKLATAAKFDDFIIAEPYVHGREFTVSLLGRDALPMIEIVTARKLFSYSAKYTSDRTQYRLDSEIPPHSKAALYRAAVEAAESLGTSGLVRVDLMLDEQQRPWVLEVNTIPGLTAQSLAPRAAAAAGLDLPMLADWMVRDAWQRRRPPAIDFQSEIANRALKYIAGTIE